MQDLPTADRNEQLSPAYERPSVRCQVTAKSRDVGDRIEFCAATQGAVEKSALRSCRMPTGAMRCRSSLLAFLRSRSRHRGIPHRMSVSGMGGRIKELFRSGAQSSANRVCLLWRRRRWPYAHRTWIRSSRRTAGSAVLAPARSAARSPPREILSPMAGSAGPALMSQAAECSKGLRSLILELDVPSWRKGQ
jgi:hypothetical protein